MGTEISWRKLAEKGRVNFCHDTGGEFYLYRGNIPKNIYPVIYSLPLFINLKPWIIAQVENPRERSSLYAQQGHRVVYIIHPWGRVCTTLKNIPRGLVEQGGKLGVRQKSRATKP